MREPKWISGAYAQLPNVVRVDGEFRGTASVEAWRGTPAEFLRPAQELTTHIRNGQLEASVTLLDGSHQLLTRLEDVRRFIGSAPLNKLLAIRIVCTDAERSIVSVLIGRPSEPGFELQVMASDQVLALGLTEAIFRQMMIGYVDRMGGWRAPFWMLSAIAPLIVVILATSSGDASVGGRILVASLAAMASVGSFLLSYPWILANAGFDLIEFVPEFNSRKHVVTVRTFLQRRRVRAAIGLLGALILGIVGNKLSDLLPWP